MGGQGHVMPQRSVASRLRGQRGTKKAATAGEAVARAMWARLPARDGARGVRGGLHAPVVHGVCSLTPLPRTVGGSLQHQQPAGAPAVQARGHGARRHHAARVGRQHSPRLDRVVHRPREHDPVHGHRGRGGCGARQVQPAAEDAAALRAAACWKGRVMRVVTEACVVR